MDAKNRSLLLESTLLPGGWANDVLVETNPGGDIQSVQADSASSSVDRVSGCVLPGMPNCHSHAHQRAMAGLGEKAGLSDDGSQKLADSFWTWREVMYRYLDRIQPGHLYAISRQLYLEMLKAGYTCVGEFQYLHHDADGRPYDNIAEMTLQCARAAADVGIGFTALPVLYRFGGFGSQDPLDGQKRFINDAEPFCELVSGIQNSLSGDQNTSVGIAPHSLRAIDPELLQNVLENLSDSGLAAVHVHIAEQTKEVDDCLTWSGERPVQWLLNRFNVDEKWCLIHATHMDDEETVRLAASAAVAGLCPTTEANLGDGFFNLMQYESSSGRWAIGSDSHISISPVEELRWLEYGQRLLYRQRNLMASTETPSTAAALFHAALQGGAQACGRSIGKIEAACRGDFVVLDSNHPRLAGRSGNDLLDSWIFSGNENPIKDVYVGGRRVIADGHHNDEEEIETAYRKTLEDLSA